ncbi:hypothetical protein OS493_039379 [Desmophyllum pertusum]|uniref:Uncharacterized protein n=1 Tax=Desmophyllum pertusum TaxID=174260 RepID=A0A9X0CZX8_9CNID|nr:hypothetical protein OS493_039379 [Desmophyllum pertusum]
MTRLDISLLLHPTSSSNRIPATMRGVTYSTTTPRLVIRGVQGLTPRGPRRDLHRGRSRSPRGRSLKVSPR